MVKDFACLGWSLSFPASSSGGDACKQQVADQPGIFLCSSTGSSAARLNLAVASMGHTMLLMSTAMGLQGEWVDVSKVGCTERSRYREKV